MNNFRLFGHLDTFAAVARLHHYLGAFQDDVLHIAGKDTAELYDQWKSVRALTMRIRRQLGDTPAKLREMSVRRLPADSVSKWAHSEDTAVDAFILPLVTNPGVVTHARIEQVHMPAGSLWWVNHRVTGCRVNWGGIPAYHLVFALERASATEDPSDAPPNPV